MRIAHLEHSHSERSLVLTDTTAWTERGFWTQGAVGEDRRAETAQSQLSSLLRQRPASTDAAQLTMQRAEAAEALLAQERDRSRRLALELQVHHFGSECVNLEAGQGQNVHFSRSVSLTCLGD